MTFMKHPVLFLASALGAGTGLVESLSGFLARICLAHSVRARDVLVRRIAPRLPDGTLPANATALANVLSVGGNRIDFNPGVALTLATALDRLTLSSGHARHTFPISGAFWPSSDRSQLGKPKKRWCPACIADPPGGIVYEPLLWRFAAVEVCPVHRYLLVGSCPHCGRKQPIVTQGVPLGHCQRCGYSLARSGLGRVPDDTELDLHHRWALWRSVAVSRILAWHSAGPVPTVVALFDGVARLLHHGVDTYPSAGPRSRSAFEAQLGMLGSDAFGHLAIGVCPTFRRILDVSMQLGVDPVRVFSGDFVEGERTWPPADGGLAPCPDPWAFALSVREADSAVRYPSHAKALDKFIADDEAVDLASVFRGLRTAPQVAAVRFPVRHPRASALRHARLQDRAKERVEMYHAAFDRVIAEGALRSFSAFLRETGFDASSLEHFVPERVAEFHEVRRAANDARLERLRREGRAALVAALDEPVVPTLVAIARRFGVEDHVVRRMYPEEARALRARALDQYEATLARCRAAMRRESAKSTPRGVKALARALGVTLRNLKLADPTLYAKLRDTAMGRGGPALRARPTRRQIRAETSACLRRKLRTALRRECRKACPRPAAAVAKELGIGRGTAYQQCGEFVQELKRIRRARVDEAFRRAEAVLVTELERPEPRSILALARELGLSKSALSSHFPELCAKLTAVRRSVSIPGTSVAACERQPKEAFLVALQAEVAAADPRPVGEVARRLGTTARILTRAEPEAVAELVRVRRVRAARKRRRLQAKLVKALQSELEADVVRPLSQIAERLGMTDAFARRLAPELSRQVIDVRLGRSASDDV